MKVKLVDLAWLAGLYEGEGSCSIVRRYSKRPAARIHLGSTDRDVIERAKCIVRMGTISVSRRPPHKTMHLWEVSRREDVKKLIELLLPFAGKRRKARLLRARKVMAQRHPCKTGRHVLTKKNTGRWPNGAVKCLDCAVQRQSRKIAAQRRRRRAARRAA